MLKYFGKHKRSDLDTSARLNNMSDSRLMLSIILKPNGEISLIGQHLKECFLQHNIHDIHKVLPEKTKEICQSIAKSKGSKITKCLFEQKTWIWKFTSYKSKKVIANLVNHQDLFSIHNEGLNNIENSLCAEYFSNSPISMCVTSCENFEILQTNHGFDELFSAADTRIDNAKDMIKNDRVIVELKNSLITNHKVEGILFVKQTSGDSYWQTNDQYISAKINRISAAGRDVLIWSFEDVTSYKLLQQQYNGFKRKFNTSIQAANEGIWEWSKLKDDGDWWSQPMYALLSLDPNNTSPSLEVIKRLMHPQERKKFDDLINHKIQTYKNLSLECRLKVKDTGFRWFRIRVVASFNHAGEINKLIGSLVDIDKEKISHIQLQQEKDKAISTLNSIVDAVITTNANGVVEYENSAAERLTGITRDELRGKSINKMIYFYKEHTQRLIDDPVMTCLRTGSPMEQKIYADMLDRDGMRYTVQVMATPLVGASNKVYGAVLVLNDVTNIRILSRRLKYQASHDILTKLINRGEFERRVNHAIDVAQNDGGDSVVLYIDLDRFKLINDICGHAAGDELLKQISKLIRSIAGEKNSVARMGGDEFAVLIKDTYYKAAEKLAKRLLAEIAAYRFSWDGKSFNIEVSIGIAEILPTCEGLAYLLNAADSACYLAKESGRNCIRKYNEGDDTIIEKKGQEKWIQQFDQALENNKLVLYGQRIAPLSERKTKTTSLEVLVRMLDEDGSIIPPKAFLPAVERYDRAYKLDKWIIDQVFHTMMNNPRFTKKLGKISINLSGKSVAEHELLDFIREKAYQYKIDQTKVCFEITETAAITNLTIAIDLITSLKDDGFFFALDDFGSGLSSFAYLKSLPVDYLKIDGIFVKDIQNDKVNYAMVKAIHEMGVVLEKQTIAEYVENEAVVDLLMEIGVDYGQGWHLGKPEPIENFLATRHGGLRLVNSAA